MVEKLKEHNVWVHSNIGEGKRLELIRERIKNTTLEDISVVHGLFKLTQILNCTFINCDFQHVDFSSCVIKDTKFINCNMSNADFRTTPLENTTFENCDMTYVIGNSSDMMSFQVGKYTLVIHKDMLYLGCKAMAIKEFLTLVTNTLDNKELVISISSIKDLSWWMQYKVLIVSILKVVSENNQI